MTRLIPTQVIRDFFKNLFFLYGVISIRISFLHEASLFDKYHLLHDITLNKLSLLTDGIFNSLKLYQQKKLNKQNQVEFKYNKSKAILRFLLYKNYNLLSIK